MIAVIWRKRCSVICVICDVFLCDLLTVLHCYNGIGRLMELFDAKISRFHLTFLDDLPRSCILTSSKGSVGRSVSVTVSWDGMHKHISTTAAAIGLEYCMYSLSSCPNDNCCVDLYAIPVTSSSSRRNCRSCLTYLHHHPLRLDPPRHNFIPTAPACRLVKRLRQPRASCPCVSPSTSPADPLRCDIHC
jgi:hypothetical protein